MSTLITSANPLGLRALGSGGRTAVASFEQITRTLRQSLGPEHAALFAEPSPRGAAIDWFADSDRGDVPVRLTEAEPALRERGLARLAGLVRDIEAKAVSLRKSDRQDERILGEMLTHALDIPGEDAVFLIGERPVMTFWGYVRDSGQPAVKPLHSLISRRRPEDPPKTAIEAGAGLPDETAVRGPPTLPLRDGIVERRWPAAVAPAILWTILTLLLLTCGVELLRGCAVGFPHSLTGWLLNYCAASPDTATDDALAAERDRQAQLQAEYEDLVREAALDRQACRIKTGSNGAQTPIPKPQPEPIETPVPPAPHKDQLRIPVQPNGDLGFLEGCWRARDGLHVDGGKDAGKEVKVTYCFNKDGTGTRTIRYNEDRSRCRGALTAKLDGDKLTFAVGAATCEGGHSDFPAANDVCRRGDEGVARCDEISVTSVKPNFVDYPFTRTTEQP